MIPAPAPAPSPAPVSKPSLTEPEAEAEAEVLAKAAAKVKVETKIAEQKAAMLKQQQAADAKKAADEAAATEQSHAKGKIDCETKKEHIQNQRRGVGDIENFTPSFWGANPIYYVSAGHQLAGAGSVVRMFALALAESRDGGHVEGGRRLAAKTAPTTGSNRTLSGLFATLRANIEEFDRQHSSSRLLNSTEIGIVTGPKLPITADSEHMLLCLSNALFQIAATILQTSDDRRLVDERSRLTGLTPTLARMAPLQSIASMKALFAAINSNAKSALATTCLNIIEAVQQL
jgi:hypothetical protein